MKRGFSSCLLIIFGLTLTVLGGFLTIGLIATLLLGLKDTSQIVFASIVGIPTLIFGLVLLFIAVKLVLSSPRTSQKKAALAKNEKQLVQAQVSQQPTSSQPPQVTIKPKATPLSQMEIERLVDAIKSAISSESSQAAFTISSRGDKRAIEPLVQNLYHYNSHVMNNTSFAIRYILEKTDPEGFAIFIRAVTRNYDAIRPNSNKNQFIQTAALHIFDKLGAKSVEPLIYLLKDKNIEISSYAASMLGRIGDERAIEPLVESINNIPDAKDALMKLGWKPDLQ